MVVADGSDYHHPHWTKTSSPAAATRPARLSQKVDRPQGAGQHLHLRQRRQPSPQPRAGSGCTRTTPKNSPAPTAKPTNTLTYTGEGQRVTEAGATNGTYDWGAGRYERPTRSPAISHPERRNIDFHLRRRGPARQHHQRDPAPATSPGAPAIHISAHRWHQRPDLRTGRTTRTSHRKHSRISALTDKPRPPSALSPTPAAPSPAPGPTTPTATRPLHTGTGTQRSRLGRRILRSHHRLDLPDAPCWYDPGTGQFTVRLDPDTVRIDRQPRTAMPCDGPCQRF